MRIILVEPAGELNMGAVARAMKNFGFHELVIVNPQSPPVSFDSLKMATHAKDLLHQAQVLPSLPEALQGCTRIAATTIRERLNLPPLETPGTLAPWLCDPSENAAVVFGPEERGLSNEELVLAQRFMRIPTHPECPSLNLAQAVAICCHELFQYQLTHTAESDPSPETLKSPQAASFEEMDAYLEHLSKMLLQIDFVSEQTVNDRMKKLRHLLYRMNPSPRELALLRGIISQTEWALKQN